MGIRLIFILVYVLVFSLCVFGYKEYFQDGIVFVDVSSLRDGSDFDAGSYQILKEHYKEIVGDRSVEVALSVLKEDSKNDQHINALCHDILHVIGKEAYDKNSDLSSSLKLRDDFCNSGYLHGVFEGYFSTVADPVDSIAQVCEKYADGQRPFDLWQCHHGLGHGLMYYTDGDLTESLELCTTVVGASYVDDCRNGVYMELFNTEFLSGENALLEQFKDDPYALCKTQEAALGFCYAYIPVYLSGALDMEYVSIFDSCGNAGFVYRRQCIAGTSAEAMKRNMDDPRMVLSLCEALTDVTSQQDCVWGGVDMYLNQTASIEMTKEMCTHAPEAFARTCAQALETKKDNFIQGSI